MQNVQNAAEIQQRVINLVELYRTKVGKESQIAKEAKEDHDYWDQLNIDMAIEAHEAGVSFFGDIVGEGPHTEKWIKHLSVNEQLLGHFYAEVAGENAEKIVLDQLLPDFYDKTIFTEEEEYFLISHFKEMVNYIILTPCNDSLELVNRYDNKDMDLIPEEVLELVASRISIPDEATIYNPFAGFAQFTNLYQGRRFLCEESYDLIHRGLNAFFEAANISKRFENVGYLKAWMKIALLANKVNVEIIENGSIPENYDAILSYLSMIPRIEKSGAITSYSEIEGLTVASKIISAYQNLKDGGVMGLLIPCTQLYENEERTNQFKAFTDMLTKEGSLAEIVQLPSVMSIHENVCLLVIRKKQGTTTTLIDARFASKDCSRRNFPQTFDIKEFNGMIQNSGKDNKTGMRKMVQVYTHELNANILIPQVYVIERPLVDEQPTQLLSLCTLESTLVRDIQFDLPEDTPWITMGDLNPLFTGDMNLSDIRKADCPNNPPFVEGSKDYAFGKDGKFVDSFWGQMTTEKGHHVLEYRHCTFLDGNNDVVLYERSEIHGVCVAVVRATVKPYVVSKGILVFCPKDGIDANSLAALLRLPIVSRQLAAYENYGIDTHLDDILVPTDKRVIGDELSRMKEEEFVTNELGDKVQAMKTEYINEVRMRKHDMGQKVFDLINTEDLMRYYVENRETETDVWPQIEEQLNHFRSTIHELSEMLDHLSQEEQFGTPELLDLNDYLANLQHSDNVNGFTLSYHLDRKSILDLQLSRMKDKDIKDIGSLKATPTVYMAKNDLQRVISNILTNAQKHGFLDSNRKDYEVNIRLKFNAEKGMYQIDFRNNGKPLPEGLNKMRYGIKGEKAGQTAGTGLGGSVVKSIVEHYKGDYDVFTDGKWTVVRIYLPIAI